MMQRLKQCFDGKLPKAVLFDLDGTLLDSLPDLTAAIDAMLADFDMPAAGSDKVRSWVGQGASILVEKAIRDAGLDESADTLAKNRFLNHYEKLCAQYTELYKGVHELLSQLQSQKVKLALVTNKPTQFLPALLARFELDAYFDLVLGGDSLAEKKPSSQPLLYVCEQFEIQLEQALMVGDSANDIDAAIACAMPSVFVTYGYSNAQSSERLLTCASLSVDCLTQLL